MSERTAGYRDALAAHGLRPAGDSSVHFEANEQSLKWRPRNTTAGVEAFVCVNDRVAGQLMHLLLGRNIKVPEDVRLVGIDDVYYASLLPVPLTTVHQPAREIGGAALRAMLDRIYSPHLPPREVLLDGELVVRQSCGAENSSVHG